ncbi:gene transfer agent family protein [Aurantimonas sp. NFXS3]|uniref:gene transfer agent family protein n=1 Tax=Aurantimonas sp. NFXS3 TaxID=2818434 RepID=UPI00328C6965
MAVNRHRGEVPAIIDGRERTLCLTLGALAELEDAFAADSLAGLAERFGSGRLSARDLTRILAAGLRGGGADVSEAEVATMRIDGGAAGAATVAAQLLAAAFGPPDGEPERAPPNP